VDQAGHRLSGIDRVEEKPFGPRCELNGVTRRGRRPAVRRPDVSAVDHRWNAAWQRRGIDAEQVGHSGDDVFDLRPYGADLFVRADSDDAGLEPEKTARSYQASLGAAR